jgi:CheY-like chemotaxis protein
MLQVQISLMAAQPVVLLVDDEPDDALFVRKGLLVVRPDARLVVVGDGVHAVNYLEGKQPYSERLLFPFPNLILLDLRLPMMSGLQVLKWIRQRAEFASMPVVVLTASLDKRDRTACEHLGANDYVLKPLGLENMRTAIREITNRWLGPTLSELVPNSDLEGDTQRKAA